MRRIKDLMATVIAVLLVACVVAAYLTRDAGSGSVAAKKPATDSQAVPVDQRLLQTARQMSSAADTSEEQDLAREALRLSDHELDQAFATALREAAAPGPPPSGPLKKLAEHIDELKARVAEEQTRIAKLTKAAAASDAASNQLELVKAQMALDQDALEDARQDLAREGGDQHAKVERALQAHEAAQQQTAQLPKATTPGRTATLIEQVQSWLALRDRGRQMEAAGQQAANHAVMLAREHTALESLTSNRPGSGTGGAAAPTGAAPAAAVTSDDAGDQEDTAAIVAQLHQLSNQTKTLSDLDQRIQDSQQLADVYKRWSAVVDTRQRGVLHLLLGSISLVLGILLAMILINRAIDRAFGAQTDRKRLHQLRVIATIAVQVAGVLLIVLIAFGAPTQMSTIIGLTTAGLTVALKDFIVAFFGWFALLGRNGLRVGDWVEIEGVSGEVIEIGVVKTVLLEMGNWATTGHPTGRRVSFVNSFAIEGHYFNFSTAGQWLWDELQIALPSTGDPYKTAQQIREVVEHETEAEASAAEQDWERVTHQYGMRPFSAKPAVDLRPSGDGLNVVVRYITRAPQRYEVKSRLFEAIVDLMHRPAETTKKLG